MDTRELENRELYRIADITHECVSSTTTLNMMWQGGWRALHAGRYEARLDPQPQLCGNVQTGKAFIRNRDAWEGQGLTKNQRKANTEAAVKASSETSMLPRALIGEIKPGNWLGFIDGIYAIILTLLLIELPKQIVDLIKQYENHPSLHSILVNTLALSILGYLALFILVYDIWAHHRLVVAEAVLNRVNLSTGILILFMSSLLPPLYHIIIALKNDQLTSGSAVADKFSFIYWDARVAWYLVVICIYGCIALIATKDYRFFRRGGDEASGRTIVLKRLRESSVAMLLVIVLVYFISVTGHIPPPYPLVLVALCTHLPVERVMITLKRRLLGR